MRNISFGEWVKRWHIPLFTGTSLRTNTIADSRRLPSKRLSPCKSANLYSINYTCGWPRFVPECRLFGNSRAHWILLSMVPRYISLLCIGFQAHLDHICVRFLFTITSGPYIQNIPFKIWNKYIYHSYTVFN